MGKRVLVQMVLAAVTVSSGGAVQSRDLAQGTAGPRLDLQQSADLFPRAGRSTESMGFRYGTGYEIRQAKASNAAPGAQTKPPREKRTITSKDR